MTGSDGLAQLVLDRLGYGLVACDRRMVVLSCTARASRILPVSDRPRVGHALPSWFERSLREAVEKVRPVRIEPSQGGRAAYLSAIEVEDMAPVVFLVWLRQEVLRESDVARALRARYELSARDTRLLFHLCSGHTNRQISAQAGFTEGTVEVYLHQLYDKLRVHTRAAAVALVSELLHAE